MIKTISLLLILLISSNTDQYVFEKVSLDLYTRTARDGKMSITKAQIFYNADGDMISYYTEPDEVYISNTKKGDVIMYNIRENTVIQRQNYLFSTENNQLYFFLEKNKSDLGLSRMGFAITNTRFEDGLKITTWVPPLQMRSSVSKVELVHNKNNPVFLGYYDAAGGFQKKVYFYKYETYYGISIPTNLTQISFASPKDSIVSKTIYSNIKFDEEVTDEYFNFQIPSSVVVIK